MISDTNCHDVLSRDASMNGAHFASNKHSKTARDNAKLMQTISAHLTGHESKRQKNIWYS